MTATATLIRKLNDFRGDARLYRLNPPLIEKGWEGEDDKTHEYVIASATTIPEVGIIETYLFPADADGNITDWGELPGSLKNTLNHGDALAAAGYDIEVTA